MAVPPPSPAGDSELTAAAVPRATSQPVAAATAGAPFWRHRAVREGNPVWFWVAPQSMVQTTFYVTTNRAPPSHAEWPGLWLGDHVGGGPQAAAAPDHDGPWTIPALLRAPAERRSAYRCPDNNASAWVRLAPARPAWV